MVFGGLWLSGSLLPFFFERGIWSASRSKFTPPFSATIQHKKIAENGNDPLAYGGATGGGGALLGNIGIGIYAAVDLIRGSVTSALLGALL